VKVTDQPARQHSPVPTHTAATWRCSGCDTWNTDPVCIGCDTAKPTSHQPYVHADTTGMHYTCTACTYTTPRVTHTDPAAAEAILHHCGHPTSRPAANAIHAAKATLCTAEQLLHRRRPLGYTRAWRLRLRAASAHATLRAGGAL
jgi:hypothetical protein